MPAQVAAWCRAGFLGSRRLCSGGPSSSSSGKPVWPPSRKTTAPMKPCTADTGECLGGSPTYPSPLHFLPNHMCTHTCTHTRTHCLGSFVYTDNTGDILHLWDSRAFTACPLLPPSLPGPERRLGLREETLPTEPWPLVTPQPQLKSRGLATSCGNITCPPPAPCSSTATNGLRVHLRASPPPKADLRALVCRYVSHRTMSSRTGKAVLSRPSTWTRTSLFQIHGMITSSKASHLVLVFYCLCMSVCGLPRWCLVKNLSASAGGAGSTPGPGRSPSSILAREILWTEEPGGL